MDRLFTSSLANYYKPSEQCYNPSKYSESCYTDQFNLPPTYPKTHHTSSRQCNSFMDDEDLSFKQFLPFKEMFNNNQAEKPNSTTNTSQFMRPSSSRSEFSELNLSEFGADSGSNGRWASNILMECK